MRIVLTGGPSAGKTTIAEAIAKAYAHRIKLVPESASILFRGGFPRSQSAPAVFCQQRAIYHVQRELECLQDLEPNFVSICDRGTLDGLAYWPGTENDFFTAIESSMLTELARYNWVIHLDTAEPAAYEHNLVRLESHVQAQALNDRVKHVWRAHPQRILLHNNRDFAQKINDALAVVKMILDGKSFLEIEKYLLKRAS